MKLGYTLSHLYVSPYSKELRRVTKVEHLGSGLPERPRWSPKSTKPKVAGTNEKDATVTQRLDSTKVEN